MEPTNALDILVLPMLQWFAGVVAAFPILHGIRVGLGRLLSEPESGRSVR